MKATSIVLCVLGAIVGAGFASGREIMQFFSRYGPFSWALALLAAMAMTALIYRIMRGGGVGGLLPGGRFRWAGEALLMALLICTGGGMTAAAGEVAALTIPLRYARTMGLFLTLAACLFFSRRPLRPLVLLGRLLLPILLMAFLLCMRVPETEQLPLPAPTPGDCLLGAFQALSYAGMNVALSAGVLCEAGARCGPRALCRGAAWSGAAIGALLLLGNGALLPHAGQLTDAALPMVMLLRAYGKMGYYLAAAALYLAVVTTLIAVLRTLCLLLEKRIKRHLYPLVGCAVALVALCGFERIVAVAYPALGALCFLLLCLPRGIDKPSAE